MNADAREFWLHVIRVHFCLFAVSNLSSQPVYFVGTKGVPIPHLTLQTSSKNFKEPRINADAREFCHLLFGFALGF